MRPRGTPIGRKLALTAKAVGTAFNAALAAEGGSAPTWLILTALKHGQWTAQLDLARSLGIESPPAHSAYRFLTGGVIHPIFSGRWERPCQARASPFPLAPA